MSSHYSSSLITRISSAKLKAIRRRLVILYGLENADHLLERLYLMIGRYGVGVEGVQKPKGLSQRDAVLITYADMVSNSDESPLVSLREFCIARLKERFPPSIFCLFILGLPMMGFPWWIIEKSMRGMETGRISPGCPRNLS